MNSLLGKLFKTVSTEHFLSLVPKGSTVLDCGTGSGGLALSFHEAGYAVDACDRDYPRMQPLRDRNIKTHDADVTALPFPDNGYDYVVCRSLLPQVDRWKDGVRDMLRVSRYGVIFHHNYSGFLPNQWKSSRGHASREDLAEFGIERAIPVAALVIEGHAEAIELELADEATYQAALAYERLVLPKMPLEAASKFIAVLPKS